MDILGLGRLYVPYEGREPSTYIGTKFEGCNPKGFRDMGHFRFDGSHLGFVCMAPLRVEPSIYIPNLKVLTRRVPEIWATSGLPAATLDLCA